MRFFGVFRIFLTKPLDMHTRKEFLKLTALGTGALLTACNTEAESAPDNSPTAPAPRKPVVISTWNHGLAANAGAWNILASDGRAIDAVEAGVMVTESDPEGQSVGIGGLPDRDGNVTLDACIMNEAGDCGSVAFLQHIENPIAVARKVMDETPHVMLAGRGAYEFAIAQGFKHTNLLTEKSKQAWEKWREESNYEPVINRENHDTIGLLALDAQGNLSGACTTSGLAYKMHGRVGDSPIIGAGLFVDNEIGAACATGMGEAVIRICGSHLVVELMRQGLSPTEACKQAVDRIMKKHKDVKNLQVGFIALNKSGEFGGHSVYGGFNYAVRHEEMDEMVDAGHELEW